MSEETHDGIRDRRCENCVYWKRLNAYVGECRRRAPVARADGHCYDWPKTNEGDWCGEFWYKDPPEENTGGA